MGRSIVRKYRIWGIGALILGGALSLGGAVYLLGTSVMSLEKLNNTQSGNQLVFWVSEQIRSELKRLKDETLKTYDWVQPRGEEAYEAPSGPLDVAYWRRNEGGGTSAATEPLFERVDWNINRHRVGSVSAWKARAALADPVDQGLFIKALQGSTQALMNRNFQVPSEVLTLVFPISPSDPKAGLIVAHWDWVEIQKYFQTPIEGDWVPVLVNERGELLGYPDANRVRNRSSVTELAGRSEQFGTELQIAPLTWRVVSIQRSMPFAGWRRWLLPLGVAGVGLLLWFGAWGVSWFQRRRFKTPEEIPIPPPPPRAARLSVDEGLVHILWVRLASVESAMASAEDRGELLTQLHSLATYRAGITQAKWVQFENAQVAFLWPIERENNAKEKSSLVLQTIAGLNMDFAAWNQARQVDGKTPLHWAMGVDCGHAWRRGREWLGPVIERVRIVSHWCEETKAGVLGTQAFWEELSSQEVGRSLGEVSLAPHEGHVAVYFIHLGKDQEEVRPVSELKAKHWMVNNGSVIEGPLTCEEVACKLFAQELDFDSECWPHGSGVSSTIAASGMFSGSAGEDAQIWLFDGLTVHGPVLWGFVGTAIQRGAIDPRTTFFCERSTVQGWAPLEGKLAA